MSINNKNIIIFSHGFGVSKDDRGLFTDISAAFPEAEIVLFDYNDVDEEQNTITVKPFSQQVDLLQQHILEQRRQNPEADIDIICHSQGSLIAALAQPVGVRKVILIAPPVDRSVEQSLKRYRGNPQAVIDLEGYTRLPRTDGSTTIVPAAYWKERESMVHSTELYNQLAKQTEVYIIRPTQDQVLGDVSFVGLSENVSLIDCEGDHDFSQSREILCALVCNILEPTSV